MRAIYIDPFRRQRTSAAFGRFHRTKKGLNNGPALSSRIAAPVPRRHALLLSSFANRLQSFPPLVVVLCLATAMPYSTAIHSYSVNNVSSFVRWCTGLPTGVGTVRLWYRTQYKIVLDCAERTVPWYSGYSLRVHEFFIDKKGIIEKARLRPFGPSVPFPTQKKRNCFLDAYLPSAFVQLYFLVTYCTIGLSFGLIALKRPSKSFYLGTKSQKFSSPFLAPLINGASTTFGM